MSSTPTPQERPSQRERPYSVTSATTLLDNEHDKMNWTSHGPPTLPMPSHQRDDTQSNPQWQQNGNTDHSPVSSNTDSKDGDEPAQGPPHISLQMGGNDDLEAQSVATRRHRKRVVLPIAFIIILIAVGAVLGGVLGTATSKRSSSTTDNSPHVNGAKLELPGRDVKCPSAVIDGKLHLCHVEEDGRLAHIVRRAHKGNSGREVELPGKGEGRQLVSESPADTVRLAAAALPRECMGRECMVLIHEAAGSDKTLVVLSSARESNAKHLSRLRILLDADGDLAMDGLECTLTSQQLLEDCSEVASKGKGKS
ncbi:uncharacterized protein F5Z01DRAFT_693384 [Emericellopsis atlantica]|uniref:Uncharacterized protein n=1 Tax=Emericellopsis atlantica TaxID=2614577 RepID=A0A9P7ZG17_9HYPO|nr:uncharacterized protein F5Z01DRAFT_693384 [Emericellopsis atlantica]KAG9251061.1 hypothetical protein F5Z01DRAFT_693384 [Emericellopsis atlantica]